MESIDTIIHIRQSLDSAAQDSLLDLIKELDGVEDARFSHSHPHLLQVRYDGVATQATTLLMGIRERGWLAHLIAL